MSLKGEESYQKGRDFEEKVAEWLKKSYGFDCQTRDWVRASSTQRGYDVDVHAWKTTGYTLPMKQIPRLMVKGEAELQEERVDVWVECKAYKVKHRHIRDLISKVKDLKESCAKGVSEWCPDILMVVSNYGFDIDALGLANEYRVYCVEFGEKGRKFIGDLTSADLKDLEKAVLY